MPAPNAPINSDRPTRRAETHLLSIQHPAGAASDLKGTVAWMGQHSATAGVTESGNDSHIAGNSGASRCSLAAPKFSERYWNSAGAPHVVYLVLVALAVILIGLVTVYGVWLRHGPFLRGK